MGKLRGHVHSNVVAYIALFVALGGTSYAAIELPKKSVQSKHIKNKSVKTKDLANDAVTSPKVLNGTLLGEDFAEGQLPQGPQGPAGSPDTPQQVLDKIKQVDGVGSGLDSDQLDGRDAALYKREIFHASVPWDAEVLAPGQCAFKSAFTPDLLPSDSLVVTISSTGGWQLPVQPTGLLDPQANIVYAVICNNANASFNPPAQTVNFLVLR